MHQATSNGYLAPCRRIGWKDRINEQVLHGTPIQKTYDEAAQVMKAVADAGVDLDDVFKVLEDEGIQKFVDSWDELTESVRSELEDKK